MTEADRGHGDHPPRPGRATGSRAPAPPLLPVRSVDETDAGWGDLPDDPAGDDERILREVPPHHIG